MMVSGSGLVSLSNTINDVIVWQARLRAAVLGTHTMMNPCTLCRYLRMAGSSPLLRSWVAWRHPAASHQQSRCVHLLPLSCLALMSIWRTSFP